MSITQQQAQLIAKLRYMGKQYAAGQVARGGAPQKHYLEEAADEIEMMAWALSMNEKTPASAQENADLRNVIQAACIDGLPGLARAWEKYFPNHPITIKGIEQGAGAAPRYGTIAERAEQGLRNGLWATQQGVAPGADVVMTERQVRIITFALHRFMNQAYWNGQEAAQDIDGKFFPQGAAMSFYKDAEDAQELLAKKPYAVLAAVQHPQQEQPTRHPGCTAGTDEECTVRRCGDVCTERKQEQPK